MSSRLAALLAAACLLPVLAGCGDGKVREANTYVKAVNGAQNTFASASDRLLAQITPDSPKTSDRAVLGRFYGVVDTFVSTLRSIKPPARVKALHERLIGALVTFGTELRGAGAALTSKSAGRILGGQQRLASATTRVTQAINTTIADINRALKG